MAYSPASSKTYTLASSIGSNDTSILLSSFTEPISNTPYTMAMLNTDIVYGTIAPKTNQREFISFTGITQNPNGTALLTGVIRGLAPSDPFTSSSTFKLPHAGQSTFILSNSPQQVNEYGALRDNEVIQGYWEAPDPITAQGLVTRDWILALINGGTISVGSVIVPGTAGETIAIGDLLYFDLTDNEWKKTDADTASTLTNTKLAIAQGAGTNGNPITNGVLLYGLDTTQTGMVQGDLMYASNTAGGISNTPGTTEKAIGIAISATQLYFDPDFYYVLPADIKAALNAAGSPSGSNPFITQSSTTTINNNSLSIPLGESFTGATTPQPALIINDLFQYRVTRMTRVGGVSLTLGGQSKQGAKLTPRSNVTSSSITALLGKVGTPGDNILITIQTDNAGSPSGSVITNGTSNTVAGSSLSSADATVQTFTFSSPFTLTAGTPYWIVFQRDSTLSDVNYYLVGMGDTTNVGDYASFVGKSENGSGTWSSGNLPYFKIIPSSGSGSFSLWQSDANATSQSMQQFMGIVTTTGSAGAAGTIYTAGTVPGFTGLIPYSNYYVSQTKGTLSLTNNGQFAGSAVSATQIYLPESKIGSRFSYGNASNGNIGTQVNTKLIIEAPFDGTLIFNQDNNTGTASTIVADASDMTTNAITYLAIANLQTAITVRKGQFFQPQTTGTAGSGYIFIPQF